MIVIHYAAHGNAAVKDIHRWHLENGWSGFGYHFLITKDGQIHRGRPENVIGAHAKSYNNISFGICMQGDYEVEKGFKAFIRLCQYLCRKYNVSTIKDHRELKSTRCPGLNFPLIQVRQMIFEALDTYTIKLRDTLWSIAKSFNMTVDEVKWFEEQPIYTNRIIRIV